MEFILQCIIIALVGSVIGGFCTILFFRLDKSWKQILLGLGSLLTTGGIWKIVKVNLQISQQNMTVVLFILIVSMLISVYACFKKLCSLLKEEAGDAV